MLVVNFFFDYPLLDIIYYFFFFFIYITVLINKSIARFEISVRPNFRAIKKYIFFFHIRVRDCTLFKKIALQYILIFTLNAINRSIKFVLDGF